VGTFGEKLRKQREQRGLALDAISNTTKISTRMLRALEDEQFDQLPGGVFNKGFVRAYARQVGLNEDETITEYLTALRESQVQSQQILPDFRSPGNKPRPLPPAEPHHVAPVSDPRSDVKNNGNGDANGGDRRRQARRSKDRDPAPRDQRNESRRDDIGFAESSRTQAVHRADNRRDEIPKHDLEDYESPDEDNEIDDARSEDSGSMSGFITLGPSTGNTEPTDEHSPRISRTQLAAVVALIAVCLAAWTLYRRHATASASAPTNTYAPPVIPSSITASASKVPAKIEPSSVAEKVPVARADASTPSSSIPPSTALVSPKPAASNGSADRVSVKSNSPTLVGKAPVTFSLLIRADQTTWVSITADGKPVIHETLIAPAHTSVRATRDIIVKVGNAAGVSFQLNGRDFPAQGNAGEVKSYLFDATGLKPLTQPQSEAPAR